MINKSVFKISIDESIKHLKGLNLFKDIGPNQIGCYSKEFKKFVEVINILISTIVS